MWYHLNPCVDLSPRNKISLFLLSTCTDQLISTPKIITFLPILTSIIENSEQESNPLQ